MMEQVEVFLSTYNGEKYLKEQIDSILAQKGVRIKLSVRDDGSKDHTVEILKEYEKQGKISLTIGKNIYLTKSYFELVNASDRESQYYAFADQDDYWEENKIIHAINCLKKAKNNYPALYYSAMKIVDSNLNFIRLRQKREINDFSKALLINEAAGCTMVFNRSLLELNNFYDGAKARMHDHWFYLLCLGASGYVFYDKKSYIQYRQHANNTVGGVKNPVKRLRFLRESVCNHPNERLYQAVDLKNFYESYFTSENYEILLQLTNYKNSIRNKLDLLKDRRFILTGKQEILFIVSILLGKF